jgi:hypothetical protein
VEFERGKHSEGVLVFNVQWPEAEVGSVSCMPQVFMRVVNLGRRRRLIDKHVQYESVQHNRCLAHRQHCSLYMLNLNQEFDHLGACSLNFIFIKDFYPRALLDIYFLATVVTRFIVTKCYGASDR